MGLILSIVLIAAILGGYQLLFRLTFPRRGPAWRLIRWVRISVVVRRAAYHLDREYEELLLR